MTVYLTIAACIILLCVLLNRLSFRFGVPMLLMFIVLGMVCGIDGLLGIPFDNYKLAEQICSTALIFIMFTGGFGTNWPQAKPVAVKAAALSTVGVFLTALLTGGFCYFVLKIQLSHRRHSQLYRCGVGILHPALQKAGPEGKHGVPSGDGKRQQRPLLLHADRHRPVGHERQG